MKRVYILVLKTPYIHTFISSVVQLILTYPSATNAGFRVGLSPVGLTVLWY